MTDRNYTCVASAMQSLKKPSIKVGDIFTTNQGCKFKVIQYINSKNILIEFDDKFKFQKTTRQNEISKGNIRNPYFATVQGIGYIGDGRFSVKENGRDTKAYTIWSHMFSRCYDERQWLKRPTYKGCTVCEEWHNFQNFAEWYESQPYNQLNYQIEKDILIDGNKIYSPQTCVLAPLEINTLFTDSAANRGDYPTGVNFHSKIKKFRAYLSVDKKQVHLGYFETVEQASQAYQVAKKANIKRMALKWQDRIDAKLFNALMAKTI